MADRRWARRVPGLTAVGCAMLLAFAPVMWTVPLVVRVAAGLGVVLLVAWIELRRGRDDAARDGLVARERCARAEAEAADRSREDFFATISHELRGPLNAILGWVHLLRSGKLDEAGAGRALETIERNAKSQAHLIRDLLEVSRIIGGKVHLDMRPIELATIIGEAVESLQPAASARGVLMESRLVPLGGAVSGDPARLHQVMENLFSNAIKFTPQGGRVTVGLGYDEKQAMITIGDTGKGIRPEFLPYVFDRFRQANGTGVTGGGLGLGLTIVRHLVELHGGSVRAESDGEGRGAQFTVTLPLSPAGNDDDSAGVRMAITGASSLGSQQGTYKRLR